MKAIRIFTSSVQKELELNQAMMQELLTGRTRLV
jgi:hypothetical protein